MSDWIGDELLEMDANSCNTSRRHRMIRRIKITNFKSIRDVDLVLDPVTVLVGRSGSGKSNLVRCIRFLRNYLLDSAQAVVHEGGWPNILPAGVPKLTASIEVCFDLPGESAEYKYGISFATSTHNPSHMTLSSESLVLGEEVLFARRLEPKGQWKWLTAPPMITPPPHQPTPMIGQFPALQKVVFAYAALSNGVGFYHFPSAVLDRQVATEQFLKLLPGLADNAGNFRDVMRGISQDFHNPALRKSLFASLQKVNPSIASLELDSLTDPKHAIVGHSAGDKIFQLSLEQESDGFRRFYAHLLALYQTPSKLTMIFEEPENAIFPGAMSLLADEFKAAPRENRGQVVLTTHSPTLLDAFDVESIRVVELRNGETQVGPVAKEQREAVKSHLLRTGELLTVEDPRMEPPQINQAA